MNVRFGVTVGMAMLCSITASAQTGSDVACPALGTKYTICVKAGETLTLTQKNAPWILDALYMEPGSRIIVTEMEVWPTSIDYAEFGTNTTIELRGNKGRDGNPGLDAVGQAYYCDNGSEGGDGTPAADGSNSPRLDMDIGLAKGRVHSLTISARPGRGGDGGEGGDGQLAGDALCRCKSAGVGGPGGRPGTSGRGGDQGEIAVKYRWVDAVAMARERSKEKLDRLQPWPPELPPDIWKDPKKIWKSQLLFTPKFAITAVLPAEPEPGISLDLEVGKGGESHGGKGGKRGKRACDCWLALVVNYCTGDGGDGMNRENEKSIGEAGRKQGASQRRIWPILKP